MVLFVTFWASLSPAAEPGFLPNIKRVVFLGDSITYSGQYIEFIETCVLSRFPASQIEFLNLGLPSETVSGLSEPNHAGGAFPRPDLHERLARVLQQTKPDLVVACYGMNDGIYYPFAEDRFLRFQQGILTLRTKAAASGARILHMTPPAFDPVPLKGKTLPAGRNVYPQPYEGYDDVLDHYSTWLLAQRASGWDVVDIHGPIARHLTERRELEPNYRLAGDGVHINATGHWIIARELLAHWSFPEQTREWPDVHAALVSHPRGPRLLSMVQQRQRMLKDAWLTAVGHQRPGMNKGLALREAMHQAAVLGEKMPALAQPLPGRKSAWNGFDRYDFDVAGKPVLVVKPRNTLPGKPWVWHGEFFGHKPAPDVALLGRGFHVAYMSIPDLLGAPQAVEYWNSFYSELTTNYGFASRVALVGLSRGGLYCYNWATANPEKVACIYADAPVCDFKSWPGGKGKGNPADWRLVLHHYHFNSEDAALAYTGNPIDRLSSLAQFKVPLLHVYGDADDVVPWDENTGVVARRYQELGGPITLIAKPGVGHHPHGLDDSTPIIDFIYTNSLSALKR